MSEQQAEYKIDPLKPCPRCGHYPREAKHGTLVYCANDMCKDYLRFRWRHEWQEAK